MNKDELIKFIKENLEIRIRNETSYVGTPDRMYQDECIIELVLDGEVISEDYIN